MFETSEIHKFIKQIVRRDEHLLRATSALEVLIWKSKVRTSNS